jgi:hypothetical protein
LAGIFKGDWPTSSFADAKQKKKQRRREPDAASCGRDNFREF